MSDGGMRQSQEEWFARRMNCPVCGAPKPTSSCAERGQLFRRRVSVSPRDRGARAYTGADDPISPAVSTPSLSVPAGLVGSRTPLGSLQAAGCFDEDGRDGVIGHGAADVSGGSDACQLNHQVGDTGPLCEMLEVGEISKDEVDEVLTPIDMQVDTVGGFVGCRYQSGTQ